jgi:WD repeat-containing protein 61
MDFKNRINARRLQVFTGHTGSIYAIALNPQNEKIYTSGGDGLVVEWDWRVPGKGVLVAKVEEPVYSLFWEGAQGNLWIGTASGKVHVIDLAQKKEVKLFESHAQGVFDFKPFSGLLVSAGGDGKLTSYGIENPKIENQIKISNKSLRCLAVSSDETCLTAGSSDYHMYVLRDNLEVVNHKFKAHDNSVFSVAYSPDGQYLLSGGRDAMLNVFAVKNDFKLIKSTAAHNLHVHHIAVKEGSDYFITSSMDKTIKIWTWQDFELMRVMDKMRHQAHVNSINKVMWINASVFASISDDKSVMIWELDS